MNTIRAHIKFLHDARPYIGADEYENIVYDLSSNALPNKGDIVRIEEITNPAKAYVVSHRVFEWGNKNESRSEVYIYLKLEGE
jgi:hypothetical protein